MHGSDASVLLLKKFADHEVRFLLSETNMAAVECKWVSVAKWGVEWEVSFLTACHISMDGGKERVCRNNEWEPGISPERDLIIYCSCLWHT